MGPNSNVTQVLIRKDHTEGRWRQRLEGLSYKLRNIKDCQGPKDLGDKGRVLPRVSGEHGPAGTLILDLEPLICNKINLCGFQPLGWWSLVPAALGNGYSNQGQSCCYEMRSIILEINGFPVPGPTPIEAGPIWPFQLQEPTNITWLFHPGGTGALL